MFVRLIERTAKPGKRTEIIAILNETLPIVKKQQGFVDAIALTDNTDPDCGITLTFWATKDDLERFYGSQEFKSQTDRIMPLVESVTVHTCNVDTSTFHKVAAVKAA
jgi:heme-degrading monooxygenase HmoA